MAILLDKACDISAFTEEDSTRFALWSVHYVGGEVQATNGAMSIRVPTLEDDFPDTPGAGDEPESLNIPASFLKDCLAKSAKVKSRKPNLKTSRLTTTDDKIIFSSTDMERSSDDTCRQVEGRFPNIDQVIPTGPEAAKVTLSADLLQKLSKHASQFTGSDNDGITFTIRGNGQGVSADYTLSDGREVRAVIMPMITN